MRTVIFGFGRMNPPTKGHQRLIEKVVKLAQDTNGHHVIFLSQTQRAPTDPLNWTTKRKICMDAFPGVWFSDDKNVKNPFIALDVLKDQYEKIILVTGSDQVADYSKFKAYAEKWGVELEIISAGERVNSSRGVAGISATKMRQYALEGKKEKFLEGLPNTINSNNKELVYHSTVIGLKEINKK
jgi:nicotinic acid mononucleotide adenylyltransferase